VTGNATVGAMTARSEPFRYGPVDFYLVGLSGDRPEPGTIAALRSLLDTGLVRLLDLVVISRSLDDAVTTTELETDAEKIGLGALAAAGIAGEEDIEDFAELVEPGTSAVLAVIEAVYQRELASSVAASGGTLLAHERVAAPIVNALMDVESPVKGP